MVSGSNRLRPSKMIGVCMAFRTGSKSIALKLVPLGCQNERFGIFNRFERRLCQDRTFAQVEFRDFVDPFWIVCLDDGAFLQQILTRSIATELRTSSVSGLNVRPHTAMRLSFRTQSVSLIFFKNRSRCVLIDHAALPSEVRMAAPNCSLIAMNAATSLGKQDPP